MQYILDIDRSHSLSLLLFGAGIIVLYYFPFCVCNDFIVLNCIAADLGEEETHTHTYTAFPSKSFFEWAAIEVETVRMGIK